MRSREQGGGAHCSIRWIAARLQSGARPAIAASLPVDPILLWGEVLTIQRRDRIQYLTLLDSKDDRAALEVSLPAGARVQIGEMICVEGRIEHRVEAGSVLRLRLRGDGIVETKGYSQRVNARERLIQELRTRVPPISPRTPVRSVVLVSSPSSKAVHDFERAMKRGLLGATAPATELIEVALDSPQDIARGVREAGARPAAALIVVTRGGGHVLDLLPFSSEEVTRAVADVAMERPLILVIGHAEDFIVAGEFAALDLDTPTAAGQYVASLCRRDQQRTGERSVADLGSQLSAPTAARGEIRRSIALRVVWVLLLLLIIAIVMWLLFRKPAASASTPVVQPSATRPAPSPRPRDHEHAARR